MPPTVQSKGLRVTIPALCFCGQPAVNPGTYYCSSECAREDALKSLTLGKPHESSSKLPPLPTLPPGFFDLPPKRGAGANAAILGLDNDNDDDDHLYDFASLSLTGKGTTDHGPFQCASANRATPRSGSRRVPATSRGGDSSVSVPRSIASSLSSTTTPSKRSKWQSHYQREQSKGDSVDESSMDIPFFLVDEVEENLLETQEIEAPSRNESKLLSPSSIVATTPTMDSSPLQRTGSFGLLPGGVPPFACKEGVPLLRHRSNTASSNGNSTSHPRSSSSSYNSLMTTAASRSSYTSPDTSPTKSDYEAPPTSAIPTRPKYGSAFGSTEGSSITGPVVQLSVDVTDSMLANRRRRKSSEDGTPRTEKVLESIQHDHRQAQKDTLDDDESLLVATTTAPLDESPKPIVPQAEKAAPPVPHTKGVTPVSKSQWSQFGLPPNRATMSRLPIAPISSLSRPMPMHVPSSVANPNLELQRPQPRSVTGTVVKKMVMPSKTRLPIGSTASTSHPPIPRPKTPSNTPSSGLSVSLQANTFRAPAYAMGTLKIPASTRTLRTSASQSSLKTKKEVVSMHIPDTIEVEVEDEEDEEQPVKVSIPVQEEKEKEEEEEEETEGVKTDDPAPAPAPAPAPNVNRKSVSTTTKKERESIKSALAGSYFKLYGTPKSKRETQQVENNRSTLSLPEKILTSRTRTSRLTLKLDSYNFTSLLGRSENSDGTPKPKPSPSVSSRNCPLSGSRSGTEQSPATPEGEGPLTPRVDFDLEGDPRMVVVMTPPMPMDNAYSSSFSRSILPLHSSHLRSPPLGSGLGLTHTKPLGSGSSNRSLSAAPSAIRSSLREPKFKR